MPTLASSSDAVTTTCLLELRIKDFALVSEEVVRFSPGLNVITGESGSGKSVLVRALLLLLPVSVSANPLVATSGCLLASWPVSSCSYGGPIPNNPGHGIVCAG